MPAVMETPWITLHLDAHAPLIRYTRTTEPYPSLREMERLHDEAARALDRLGRPRHSLLVDMRASPMNNDPGFERSAARARDATTTSTRGTRAGRRRGGEPHFAAAASRRAGSPTRRSPTSWRRRPRRSTPRWGRGSGGPA